MSTFHTQLQKVARPPDADPDLANEVFVRLVFIDPEDGSGGCAFTMTVTDMLALFYGLASDLKQIVQEDALGIPLGPGVWGFDG